MKPDTTVRTAAQVATHTIPMLNRASALANFAYGEDLEQSQEHEQEQGLAIQEEIGALNKKGRYDLPDLYKNNHEFRDEIINFVGVKTGLGNEKILDKTNIYNTLNKLVMGTLAKFVWSRYYTGSLIEISARYKEWM